MMHCLLNLRAGELVKENVWKLAPGSGYRLRDACTHTHTNTYTYTHIHIHTCAHTQTHMHTHKHTHVPKA
jgi:hypothetical protein